MCYQELLEAKEGAAAERQDVRRRSNMRILITIFVLVFVVSCAPKQEVREPGIKLQRAVPGIALERTIQHIVDLVGHDFFESNIEYLAGVGDGDLYVMTWEIDVDSRPGANYRFLIGVDAEGNLKKPIDLPNCSSAPENCRIDIDKERAVEITKRTLEIKDDFELVDITFGCDGTPPGSFVWRVAGRPPKLSRETGATVIINAATGEILGKESWRRYEPPKSVMLPPPLNARLGFD
jgi:hypothetical protein